MRNEAIDEQQILEALSTVQDPDLHRDLVTLGFVKDIKIKGADIAFSLRLTTPACPLKDVIRENSERAIRERLPGAGRIDITFEARVRGDKRILERLDLPIENIIAVGSGKGGVGKSTVAVNLAVALARTGAKVGLLDADIYGPNIPTMMGLSGLPAPDGKTLVPAFAHGVKVMSMGFLVGADEALVWRGPMIHGALSQLLKDVAWGELDYLVVDLPPGTGDAQLSIAQLVPLTGGVVVTTPQLLSISDARRGVDAFRKLGVPVLGIVENMSGDAFGRGGGARAAEELGLPLLASIPLDPIVSRLGDEGRPPASDPEAVESGLLFRELAGRIAAAISVGLYEKEESRP